MDVGLPALLALLSAVFSLLLLGRTGSVLALALAAGFLLYLRTLRRHLPRAESVLPLYLGALAWQLLHFLEEFATGLQRELPRLFGEAPLSDTRFLAVNMVFYALFLVSGIALVKGVRPLTWFASFFVVALFVNGVGHPLLAVWSGGYFPGLATGWAGLVWGVLLLRRMRPDVAAPGAGCCLASCCSLEGWKGNPRSAGGDFSGSRRGGIGFDR